MHKSQLELLLNTLYNCSIAIHNAIVNNDEEELNILIKKKKELLKAISTNKKFLESSDFLIYDYMLEEIRAQEKINIKLLKESRSKVYKQYQRNTRTSKILNKYSPNEPKNGSIVDIKD